MQCIKKIINQNVSFIIERPKIFNFLYCVKRGIHKHTLQFIPFRMRLSIRKASAVVANSGLMNVSGPHNTCSKTIFRPLPSRLLPLLPVSRTGMFQSLMFTIRSSKLVWVPLSNSRTSSPTESEARSLMPPSRRLSPSSRRCGLTTPRPTRSSK